jgi:transcriptional regulator EpsA
MHTHASEAEVSRLSSLPAGGSAVPEFQLSTEDGAVLLRILSESLQVNRHYDLLQWLSGDLQQFLPHSLLISAWGNFEEGELSLDVVSALPGVRTEGLRHCRMKDLVAYCHAQWLSAGRQPLVLPTAGATSVARLDCKCAIHGALRGMRSLLVHGFRDERSGQDSLYICFNPASFTRGRCMQAFLSLVPLLVGPIDTAFRRVAALRQDEPAGESAERRLFALTRREREIVQFLCEGRSNAYIAATLGISLFTVKNHLRSIFHKVGAESRAQVVAIYHRARRRSGRPARR